MIHKNALAAIKLWNRIIRQYCHDQIKAKRNEDEQMRERGILDEELFVDLKFDLKNPEDYAIFEKLNEARER